MDFANRINHFRIQRFIQKMIVGQDNRISDKLHDGDPFFGHVFHDFGRHADLGHLRLGMGLIVAVDKKITLITVDPNSVVAFFRLNPVQFIGYPTA
jgi:hypothetical protein